MIQELHEIYEFAGFRLSSAERVLRRGSEILPLTPKAFETLFILVRHAENVVSKEDLMRAVWPDSFVEEGNLAQNIFTLRKAMGEKPGGGHYIETVPKRGYRLAVAVAAAAAKPAPTPPRPLLETVVATPLPSRWRPKALAVLAVVLIAGLGLAAGWVSRHNSTSSPAVHIAAVAIPNDIAYGVISPDSTQVAYISYDQGAESLWIRPIDSIGAGERRTDPRAGQFWSIAFSPDSRFLYYTYEDFAHPTNGALFRVPADGGASVELLQNIASARISPDGRRIAFKRYESNGAAQLLTAALDGSGIQVAAASRASFPFYGFQWAAESKSIFFTEGQHAANANLWTIQEIPASGGAPRIVTGPRPGSLRSVAWLNRSEAIAAVPEPGSTRSQIWRLLAGKPAQRLTNDRSDYTLVSATADGNKVLASSLETRDRLWIAPAPGASASEPSEIALPTGSYNDPAWTPDGRIVFVAQQNLWISTPDGRDRRPLLTQPAQAEEPEVSPDGAFLVFVQSSRGARNLWRIGVDGRGLHRLTNGDSDDVPVISPDGKWVLYLSTPQMDRGIWKVPVDGSAAPIRLAKSGARSTAISPDGKHFAANEDDGRLVLRSFDTGALERTLVAPPYPADLQWSVDGKSVLYVLSGDGPKQFWSQPAAGGPAAQLGSPLPRDVFDIAWSPDRKRILYLRRAIKVDLSLLTNFR